MTYTIGAVAYDPKVVTIWDGFTDWFADQGFSFDYVLYRSYERQVEGLLRGEHQASWNSPLAWIQAERAAAAQGRRARAIAMRDTDRDLRSVVLVRADSPARRLTDLAGARVAVGASDSPQATLIPLEHIAAAGLEVELLRHEVMVGKHGDHVGGERDAARALLAGNADAACIIDGNLLAFTRDGTLPAGSVRVLDQTGLYDHCNFTVIEGEAPEEAARFAELLLAQDFADPRVRPLMELEGLKKWLPGRVEGYALLNAAVDRFGDPWLSSLR